MYSFLFKNTCIFILCFNTFNYILAAQFTYNREKQHVLSSYMEEHQNDENIPEEEEFEDQHDLLHDSACYQRPKLNDMDNGNTARQ